VAIVQITGWREGFEKVSHTRTLQDLAQLSLSDAKAMTDAILDGQSVAVELPTQATAEALAQRLRALGADATVAP